MLGLGRLPRLAARCGEPSQPERRQRYCSRIQGGADRHTRRNRLWGRRGSRFQAATDCGESPPGHSHTRPRAEICPGIQLAKPRELACRAFSPDAMTVQHSGWSVYEWRSLLVRRARPVSSAPAGREESLFHWVQLSHSPGALHSTLRETKLGLSSSSPHADCPTSAGSRILRGRRGKRRIRNG